MKSGSKVFGSGGTVYKTSGQDFKGVSLATRKKVDSKKLELIRAWKKNLAGLLRVGTGLDVHLDTAMRELVEELSEWDDKIKQGKGRSQ
jgi:hypothetical protein